MINENLICMDLDVSSKEEAVNALAKIAVDYGKVNSAKEYVAAVLEREKEYSTGVGYGVAIPHGKSSAVNEPFFMFAKAGELEWDSLDGKPVEIIFMIGVPMEGGNTHLKILATLSRMLMKEEFRTKLKNASDKTEVLDILAANNII